MINNNQLIALAKSNAKKSKQKFADSKNAENYFRKMHSRFVDGDCVRVLDKYPNGVNTTHLRCMDNDIFVDVEICDSNGVYAGIAYRIFKPAGETPKYLIKL